MRRTRDASKVQQIAKDVVSYCSGQGQARMAYHFELDANSKVILFRFSGAVSEQRTDEFYREAGAQLERIRPRAAIFDFTEVTAFEVSPASVRNLADAPPLVTETSCPRVVVAPADHIFAMSRMFQIRGERSRPSLRVVHTMAEALALLGLEHPDFKPLEPD